ncbi:ubiquitin carboxyl-terminal hydrolase 24-like [Bombina bombina]|uniref:ubiquitin carboxyl-terminal hydrolase 24-like n=1 Tax=Bombina bombina TaxID=8345 RepID=UPI00235B213A|nr:ubiquitin carboxyl-terminal hydrolase 24-like [Bombina bombina]
METEEEQHMTTLLCMGFSDPSTIRKALRLAKNDINEAVALLTNERPGLDYGYEPMDSGQRGSGDGSNRGSSGFDPPPAYHEVVEPEVRAEVLRRESTLLPVMVREGTGGVTQGGRGSAAGMTALLDTVMWGY